MSSLNKVMLIGRIGNTIELRKIPSGSAVTTLSVATNDSYNDKNGNRITTTDWHQVEVWGKQAESCVKYLSKGSLIFVEGSLKTQVWEDESGKKQKNVKVKAKNIQFLNRVDDGKDQAPAKEVDNFDGFPM